MTCHASLQVPAALTLVATLLHLVSFFLPVVYLGKTEAMFQQVPAVLTTATPPLVEFRPKSVSYLWSNLLPINATVALAVLGMAVGWWTLARNASFAALLLAGAHLALFNFGSWGGERLLAGYYLWLGSIASLAGAAFLGERACRGASSPPLRAGDSSACVEGSSPVVGN